MTIYAGSLPESWDDAELRRRFEVFGPVKSALVLVDPQTGRSRGFGFVVMPRNAGEAAIEELDGLVVEDSFLRVNESRDRGAKPPRRKY